jgi:hypothetical protein
MLALGACGAIDPGRPLPGESTSSGGKADDAQEGSDLDRLVTLLRAEGTLTMPPLGVDHAANELEVTVTVHAADEVKAVAQRLIAEASESYVLDPATGTLVDHYDDDIHVLLVSGWNDEAILGDLLSMVDSGERDAVSDLLDGYLLHFRIYQTASEITAEEIFVYRPTNLDRAIIIRFSYAHA